MKNRGRSGSLKQERKKIAAAQIDELFARAIAQHKTKSGLASNTASVLWNISTRFNVRLGRKRVYFCRRCKSFIVPPFSARYRLSKKRSSMNITCLKCGNTYRKMLPN